MVSTFITPVIGRAAELGVSAYEDNKIVELCPNDSVETINIVIRAVYRQVLGNAYVMESERLVIPESKLKQGRLSVREFVREVAYSELYKSRFFDICPRYRSIELNFKHLLGRSPDSYEETNAHSQVLDLGGHQAEIDSYVDSEEYQHKFGENVVPYYCGYKTQTGKNIVGFTHLFKLIRGASSSDKRLTTKNESRIANSLFSKTPSAIIPPSNVSSYGGVTDINKLLTNALNLNQTEPSTARGNGQRQSSQASSSQRSFSQVSTETYGTPAEKSQQQTQKIAELEQKLASLSSLATIGLSQTSKWQASGISGANISSSSLNQPNQTITPEQKIAELEQKIADAQRLATIGEARLNKWRSRSFF